MNPANANHAGQIRGQVAFTDRDLADEIEVLEIVTAYLDGRGDCGLVNAWLLNELEGFQRMMEERYPK